MIINMKYTNMYVIPDIFRYTKHAWAGLGGLTTCYYHVNTLN